MTSIFAMTKWSKYIAAAKMVTVNIITHAFALDICLALPLCLHRGIAFSEVSSWLKSTLASFQNPNMSQA